MKLRICAVGRLRAGPERTLIDDYLERFERTGRSLGLGPVTVHEIEAKGGGGMDGEAALLLRTVPKDAVMIALDERGRMIDSPGFAGTIAGWRDAGRGELAVVIGGADGLAPDLRARADLVLSFGTMVWPHMLVRVMLAEQLYRAASILAGSPYHRA